MLKKRTIQPASISNIVLNLNLIPTFTILILYYLVGKYKTVLMGKNKIILNPNIKLNY